MSRLSCAHCGQPVDLSAARCPACGGIVVPLPDDTTMEVTDGVTLLAELLAAQRVERTRSQLALGPDESALVVTRGRSEGSCYVLRSDVVTFGRDSSAHILLDDISVSRFHAEISRGPHGYRIVDKGSLNGTYVNRSPIEEADLVDGDEIQVGLFRLMFVEGRTSPSTRIGRGRA
jgi:hypothetical protein